MCRLCLGYEGILNIEEVIEFIDHNEVVDSDDRGCLTDLNLELYLEDEFNKEQ